MVQHLLRIFDAARELEMKPYPPISRAYLRLSTTKQGPSTDSAMSQRRVPESSYTVES